ncbi:MAG: hypothetical protein GX455_01230 [Phycisphaerae bacterium]|nr:hypothetical protein [Phycisphaerae bacterium]
MYNGINRPILEEIANDIVRQDGLHKIDLMVFTGDLIENSDMPPIQVQYENWMSVMRTLTDAGIHVLCCRGNHDSDWPAYFGSDAYPLFKQPDNGPPGEQYMTYSKKHQNAVFIVLDTFSGLNEFSTCRINLPWLQSVLSDNRQPHVFVFGHVPAFKALHEDCLDDYPQDRDRFWQTLALHGARTYMCSHDHFYDRARIDDGDGDPDNDLQQLIVATAGAPLYPAPHYNGDNGIYQPINQFHAMQFGYMIVEVNDLSVTMTWMQRDNALPGMGAYFAADSWDYQVSPRPVSFPDVNLRQLISHILGVENPTPRHMLELTELSADDRMIRDLEGLQFAHNLHTADLRNNQIESIRALLDLDQLSRVDLRDNPLSIQTYCREVADLQQRNPAAKIHVDPPKHSLLSDCSANERDLDILSQAWLQTCIGENAFCTRSDLDQSGGVDLNDLRILAEFWLAIP